MVRFEVGLGLFLGSFWDPFGIDVDIHVQAPDQPEAPILFTAFRLEGMHQGTLESTRGRRGIAANEWWCQCGWLQKCV